jgi:RHS repeat-associated protein
MPQLSANFTYDPRNNLSSINRLNGVSSTFAYDQVARLLSITHTKGASVIDAETYGYDHVGNRTTHGTNIGQSLITPAVPGAVYNADNEQVQFGSTANTFDANGILVSAAGAGGTATYTWDSRNRLKSIAAPNGQTTSFTYDFAGNLIRQTDSGSILNLTRSFVLDELTNVAFESETDGTSYSVLSGQSIDSHLAIAQSTGQVQYGLTDAINSTVATVNQTGSLTSQFEYEPFGQTTGTGSAYPFQFTGKVPVSNNLYYDRARFFNANTGRFISEDPIGFGGGDPNLYRYVFDASTEFLDPYGLVATRRGPYNNTPQARAQAEQYVDIFLYSAGLPFFVGGFLAGGEVLVVPGALVSGAAVACHFAEGRSRGVVAADILEGGLGMFGPLPAVVGQGLATIDLFNNFTANGLTRFGNYLITPSSSTATGQR